MPNQHIDSELVRVALDRVEGFPFERFVNSFYAPIVGRDFVPLGGVKDGGADGFDGSGLLEDATKPGHFYQASITEDAAAKILATVARLREFGREPKRLTYLTSRVVRYLDRLEEELTDELDVTITIRDGAYIAAHINASTATQGAFDEHLRHYTDFLKVIGAAGTIPASSHVKNPAVFVFLAQELERRAGDESLVDAVTDALALWALEGTDPDEGILRTADEVMALINEALPSVRSLVEPRLADRLEAMGAKDYTGGRAVKHHRREGGFCLPYDVRERVEEENAADEALRLEVLTGFQERLTDNPIDGLEADGVRAAGEVALRALQMTFEHEGLEFAAFLENTNGHDFTTVTDSLAAALAEAGHSGAAGKLIGTAAYTVVRGVLYDSRPAERDYLQRLARTYAILFTLSTEPRLIEFFQEMTGDYRLYVGADQLVRALSEHYLAPADQMTRTTLLMAMRSGAKLILTEPVLEEVVHHLRVCDYEYVNHVQTVEPRMTFEMARQAPHILLRTYLYARLKDDLGKRQPATWPAFVNQFCTYGSLHKSAAYDEVRQYLQATFNLTYESKNDLERLVKTEDVDKLAQLLLPVKHNNEDLARNDALLALAVYGRRRKRGEESRVTEFGWSTWWLTGETAILWHTRDIVRDHGGARYIMRPDFLLNYLTLAPSAAEARATFASVFPSLLGIRLSRRMNKDAFNKIVDRVHEAETLDDARRTVVISKALDELKSDFDRRYLAVSDAVRDGVDAVAERDA